MASPGSLIQSIDERKSSRPQKFLSLEGHGDEMEQMTTRLDPHRTIHYNQYDPGTSMIHITLHSCIVSGTGREKRLATTNPKKKASRSIIPKAKCPAGAARLDWTGLGWTGLLQRSAADLFQEGKNPFDRRRERRAVFRHASPSAYSTPTFGGLREVRHTR